MDIEKVCAEIFTLTSGLGFVNEQTQNGNSFSVYYKGEYCLEHLKDINRLLRQDDPVEAVVFRQIGRGNLVSSDLVVLFEQYAKEDFDLGYQVFKMFVALTLPPPNSSPHEREMMTILRKYKYTLATKNSFDVYMDILAPILLKTAEERSTKETNLIELGLCLVRNLLLIPDGENANQSDNCRDSLIKKLNGCNFLKVVTYVCNCISAYEDLAPMCLELLYLLLTPYKAEQLIEAELEYELTVSLKANQENEAAAVNREQAGGDAAEALKVKQQEKKKKMEEDRKKQEALRKIKDDKLEMLYKKEESDRARMKKQANKRHTKFGGVFSYISADKKFSKVKTNVSTLLDNNFDEGKTDKRIGVRANRAKKLVVSAKSKYGGEEQLGCESLCCLSGFCCHFLALCYDQFMSCCEKKIDPTKHLEEIDEFSKSSDIVNFYQVQAFFLSYNRKRHKINHTMKGDKDVMSMVHIGCSLERNSVLQLAEYIGEYHQEIISNAKPEVFQPRCKNLYACMDAFYEVVKYIEYTQDEKVVGDGEKDQELIKQYRKVGKQLLSNLIYERTPLYMLPGLNEKYNPIKQSTDYFSTLVEVTELLVKLVERYGKSKDTIYVKKKKRTRIAKVNDGPIINEEEYEEEAGQEGGKESFGGDEEGSSENGNVESNAPEKEASTEANEGSKSHANGSEERGPEEEAEGAASGDGDTAASGELVATSKEAEEEPIEYEYQESFVDVTFEFGKFELMFGKTQLINNYANLLHEYSKNRPTTNMAIVKMFHRIAVSNQLEPMFYQLSVMVKFQEILNTAELKRAKAAHSNAKAVKAGGKDMSKGKDKDKYTCSSTDRATFDFLKYIVHNMFKTIKKNPLMFLEILFWKDKALSLDITLGLDEEGKYQRFDVVKRKEMQKEKQRLREEEIDDPDREANGQRKKGEKEKLSKKNKNAQKEDEHRKPQKKQIAVQVPVSCNCKWTEEQDTFLKETHLIFKDSYSMIIDELELKDALFPDKEFYTLRETKARLCHLGLIEPFTETIFIEEDASMENSENDLNGPDENDESRKRKKSNEKQKKKKRGFEWNEERDDKVEMELNMFGASNGCELLMKELQKSELFKDSGVTIEDVRARVLGKFREDLSTVEISELTPMVEQANVDESAEELSCDSNQEEESEKKTKRRRLSTIGQKGKGHRRGTIISDDEDEADTLEICDDDFGVVEPSKKQEVTNVLPSIWWDSEKDEKLKGAYSILGDFVMVFDSLKKDPCFWNSNGSEDFCEDDVKVRLKHLNLLSESESEEHAIVVPAYYLVEENREKEAANSSDWNDDVDELLKQLLPKHVSKGICVFEEILVELREKMGGRFPKLLERLESEEVIDRLLDLKVLTVEELSTIMERGKLPTANKPAEDDDVSIEWTPEMDTVLQDAFLLFEGDKQFKSVFAEVKQEFESKNVLVSSKGVPCEILIEHVILRVHDLGLMTQAEIDEAIQQKELDVDDVCDMEIDD
eukprot:Nk52_evm14s327 gene=Nk52_evmTU14s327